MRTIQLPDNTSIPVIGQGTWYLGENPTRHDSEIAALRWGAENGLNLIDTAEMYGEGASEALVGEAIAPFRREDLFLVSKVYPWNAGRANIFTSCQNSLDRLGTDHLDLYLLHWRGGVPLAETVACMEELVARGRIRRWGVSNFDLDDMEELFRIRNGEHCAVVQDLYHLGSRGIEFSLLPFLRREGIPMMAYSPLAHNGSMRRTLLHSDAVQSIAQARGIEPIQVLLAFVASQDGVFAIPRTGCVSHTQSNRAAADVVLTAEEQGLLDQAFPAPRHKVGLDML